MLRDLGDIVTSTKTSVANFPRSSEFSISAAFANALVAAFPDYSFEFYEKTVKVKTPSAQYIYVPGQSFALASRLMDFCAEIGKYRTTAYRILNRYREQINSVAGGAGRLDERVFTALRDRSNNTLTETFKAKAMEFFLPADHNDGEAAEADTEFLMRFLTHYGWWGGAKQISRANDWSISAITTLLNMPQNDSNFIARVTHKATEDAEFRNAFTHAVEREWRTGAAEEPQTETAIAENILLYGVPGCGKSHTIRTEYCDDDDHMERTVFHPDYTYSDFVGQILPRVREQHIEYSFEPGPFTRILKKAKDTPAEMFYLIVEEINRGNAPAIFGDIFQLLDRDETGRSEYGISNENIASYVCGDPTAKIRIPENLFVLATMNTSDQNVFTLDTAFKRRWTMRMIQNNIDACEFAGCPVCGEHVTWGSFAKTINNKMTEIGEANLSNEDHRLGAYFVKRADLNSAERFGEKVLMYLWNDAFKFDRDRVFRPEYRTLDELVSGFIRNGFAIFNEDIVFMPITEETETIEEEETEPPVPEE